MGERQAANDSGSEARLDGFGTGIVRLRVVVAAGSRPPDLRRGKRHGRGPSGGRAKGPVDQRIEAFLADELDEVSEEVRVGLALCGVTFRAQIASTGTGE
jgi:hypothetical protein